MVLRLFLFCVVFQLISIKYGNCFGDLESGVKQAEKVATGLCWYEKVKKMSLVDEKGVSYFECLQLTRFTEKPSNIHIGMAEVWPDPEMSRETKRFHAKAIRMGISHWIEKVLPKIYSENCDDFLVNIHAGPRAKYDYGNILGDSEAEQYPYKWFSHCLLHTLELRNGEDALNDLKSRWANPKSFQEAMLVLQNEHRAHHGSPPLELDKELAARAQKWANVVVHEKRTIIHTRREDPDRLYKDQAMGENVGDIMKFDGLTDEEIGEIIALEWYRELGGGFHENYSFESPSSRRIFERFTQTVWKATSHVGYGISRSSSERKNPIAIVVARYWPAGNVKVEGSMTEYVENVLPPQN